MTEDAGRAIGRREEGMTVKHRLEWLTGGGTLVSIVMIVFGLILLLWPGHTLEVAARVVGIGLLAGGALVNLTQSLELRRVSYTRWQWPLVMAILTVLLGVLLVLNPLEPIKWAVMLIGTVLIFNGATNLYIGSKYRKYY